MDLLWDQVSAENEDLPEKVIQAVELLLSGEPRYKVAKKLNVSSRTVKNWLEKYTLAREVLKIGYTLLSRWRMAKIEQQFLEAVEVSHDILTEDGDDANVKLMGIKAQHARFIDKMLNPQTQQIIFNIHEKEDSGVYKARKDALDYIQDVAIEGSFVEDEEPGPAYGSFGFIDTDNENKAMCHICGEFFHDLKSHVEEHDISAENYEIEFMLEHGTLNKWQTKE